jgi:hypothetical protein
VSTLSEGILALTKSIPKLHSAISGGRNNLAIVRREGNRENILGVTNEATSALSSADLPQTKSGIPRTRKGELSVRADGDVRDEVVVSTKSTLGSAVVFLSALEVPDNDGLK